MVGWLYWVVRVRGTPSVARCVGGSARDYQADNIIPNLAPSTPPQRLLQPRSGVAAWQHNARHDAGNQQVLGPHGRALSGATACHAPNKPGWLIALCIVSAWADNPAYDMVRTYTRTHDAWLPMPTPPRRRRCDACRSAAQAGHAARMLPMQLRSRPMVARRFVPQARYLGCPRGFRRRRPRTRSRPAAVPRSPRQAGPGWPSWPGRRPRPSCRPLYQAPAPCCSSCACAYTRAGPIVIRALLPLEKRLMLRRRLASCAPSSGAAKCAGRRGCLQQRTVRHACCHGCRPWQRARGGCCLLLLR